MERSGSTSIDPSANTGRVGPVLLRGQVSDVVIAAIRQRHADADVLDRGAYKRVLVSGECRLLRAEIEASLGRPFHFPSDLEAIMPSWKGRLELTPQEARWLAPGSARRQEGE